VSESLFFTIHIEKTFGFVTIFHAVAHKKITKGLRSAHILFRVDPPVGQHSTGLQQPDDSSGLLYRPVHSG
jgi:hypothetical protein